MSPQDDPKPEQAESLKQARLLAVQLAGDFVAVFGEPAKRSDAQKRVIAHLAESAGEGSNSFDFGRAGDGISLIARGIHRDGAQSLLRIIDRQITIYHRSREGEKPLPKIRR